MRPVNRLIQFWTVRAAPGANAQKFFGYLVLMLSLVTTVLVALSTSDPHIKHTNIIAALLWAALLLALRLGVSITKVCHWGAVIALMQIYLRSWFSGGLYASALVWLPVLVVATYFLLGRGVAMIWALINLLLICILAVSPAWWNAAPLLQGLSPQQGVIALVDQSLGLISINLVMLFYYQFDKKAYADLLDRQAQLHSQSKKLEQAEATHARLMGYTQGELQYAIESIAELNEIIATSLQNKPGALLVLEHTQRSSQAMLQTLQSLPNQPTDLKRPQI